MPLAPVTGAQRERALAKLLPQNGLLAALPEDVRARLLPHLALVDLPAGHQLGEAGGRFARAFFPVTGVVALLRGIDDTQRLAALVGSEGAAGLPRFMSDSAGARPVVQCGGYGLALGREQLLEEWARGGTFMRVLLRYSRALAGQSAIVASCRASHTVDQHLSLLLLMTLDRLPGQEVELSVEHAARLTGAASPEVTAAIERLRSAGVAVWRRPGVFAVHDRSALRALACGCGGRLAIDYQRLVPSHSPAISLAAAPDLPAETSRLQRREALAASARLERPHS